MHIESNSFFFFLDNSNYFKFLEKLIVETGYMPHKGYLH